MDTEVEKIEAQARMLYNKETKSLDMGNLRASDYKFNRFIHLPRPEEADRSNAQYKEKRNGQDI